MSTCSSPLRTCRGALKDQFSAQEYFCSSDSRRIILIPILEDVHARGSRCFTVLGTESHRVIRNTFNCHLPFMLSHQRTSYAKFFQS